MKISELRPLSDDELKSRLLDLKKNAFSMRLQKVAQKLENTSLVRKNRRDIARIQTMQTQRRLDTKSPKPLSN